MFQTQNTDSYNKIFYMSFVTKKRRIMSTCKTCLLLDFNYPVENMHKPQELNVRTSLFLMKKRDNNFKRSMIQSVMIT